MRPREKKTSSTSQGGGGARGKTCPSAHLHIWLPSNFLLRYPPSGTRCHSLVPQRRLFLVSTKLHGGRVAILRRVFHISYKYYVFESGIWYMRIRGEGRLRGKREAWPSSFCFGIVSPLFNLLLPVYLLVSPGKTCPSPLSHPLSAEADASERTSQRTRRCPLGLCVPDVCVRPQPGKAAGWKAWNARVSRCMNAAMGPRADGLALLLSLAACAGPPLLYSRWQEEARNGIRVQSLPNPILPPIQSSSQSPPAVPNCPEALGRYARQAKEEAFRVTLNGAFCPFLRVYASHMSCLRLSGVGPRLEGRDEAGASVSTSSLPYTPSV